MIVYALAQTAITNFRDLTKSIFDKDISDEITLSLLPLALGTPLDPVEFVKASQGSSETSASVRQFTERLKTLVVELEDQNRDTGRLFTVFKAKLESTKKIAKADFVVGVQAQAAAAAANPMLVHRPIDPNSTHPYREADIIAHKDGPPGLGIVIGNQPITQHPFRALTAYLKAKEDPRYYWRDKTGAVTRYSDAYVERLKKLSPDELAAALKAYRKRKNI